MKPSERTIVFLAHSLESGMREVVTLRRELTEAMRINAELTAQAKAYEAEAVRNKKVIEGIRMTVSLLAFNDPTRTFIESQLDAAMVGK